MEYYYLVMLPVHRALCTNIIGCFVWHSMILTTTRNSMSRHTVFNKCTLRRLFQNTIRRFAIRSFTIRWVADCLYSNYKISPLLGKLELDLCTRPLYFLMHTPLAQNYFNGELFPLLLASTDNLYIFKQTLVSHIPHISRSFQIVFNLLFHSLSLTSISRFTSLFPLYSFWSLWTRFVASLFL